MNAAQLAQVRMQIAAGKPSSISIGAPPIQAERRGEAFSDRDASVVPAAGPGPRGFGGPLPKSERPSGDPPQENSDSARGYRRIESVRGEDLAAGRFAPIPDFRAMLQKSMQQLNGATKK